MFDFGYCAHCSVFLNYFIIHPKLTVPIPNFFSSYILLSQPFYKATNELEGQDDCTLHLVIPWIKKLQLHCAVNETDSPEIQTLKSNALEFIKVNFNLKIHVQLYL